MSTSVANHSIQAVGVESANGATRNGEDPFTMAPSPAHPPHPHRFSSFDAHLFALNYSSSSPSQAKRALEAHLAETERRLQEASKLGTALVQQRKDLSERLKDVEQQQGEREIGPELRQKLVEVEKEYHEVGRESARAFLAPKSRASIPDESAISSFALDGRVCDCFLSISIMS